MFEPGRFFDLSGWGHAAVFPADSPVWAALGPALAAYLEDRDEWLIEGEVSPGAHLVGSRIAIGPGSRVEPGAVLVGPVVIGARCTIRAGAYVRDHALIGDEAIVGAHSEVKGSILLPGARAPHQNYVGDSILGREVNLGAGTICSNVKNVGREVSFRAAGAVVHTGLRKLGAILGDGCKTGCNTVLNPGVLMGPGSITYPNATLRSGLYPAGTLVKVRQQQQTIELDRLRDDG